MVEAVNFNDPKQTVIAGSKAGVDKACEVLKARGAKRALPLPVSAPFHSSLMKPAAERLRERLAAIALRRAADSGDQQHRRGGARPMPTAIRDALYRQAFGPVRWVEVVQAHARARRDPRRRVRPGQGAGRHGQAHRRRDWSAAHVLDPASRWPT